MVISLAALGCGLAAVALGLILLLRTDSDVPPSSAETEPTKAAAANPTTEVTSEPGMPFVRVVGDVSMPRDVTMLTTTGGYAHGTGLPWRVRMISGSSNGPRVIGISTAGEPEGQLMGILEDPAGGLFAAVCSKDECASEGTVTDAVTAFYRSVDGGFRWTEINRRDGRWWLRLAVAGDAIAVNFDGQSAAAVYVVSNAAINRQEPWAGLVSYKGKPAWISSEFPMLVGEQGQSLVKFDQLPIDARVLEYADIPGTTRTLVSWMTQTPNEKSHGYDYRYFVTASDDGKFRTFETKAPIGGIAGFWGSDKWLIEQEVSLRPTTCKQDYAKDGDHGLSPAVFHPATGDIAFLAAPFFPDGCAEGAETVVATWLGPTATVETGSDCLNLRAGPSANAEVQDCLQDGTVVLTNGLVTESGGTRWKSVKTLGGRSGWVAESFLGP